MLASRNSNFLNVNAVAITYSTLTGNTKISVSSIAASSIVGSTINANTVLYSTMTGSSIITSTITATSLIYSSITGSTLIGSSINGVALGIGQTFLSTIGSTISIATTVPQYQADISGTTRTTVMQYQDNTAVASGQLPLDYNTFGQSLIPSAACNALWSSVAMSANGQIQVACVNGGALWYSSSYGNQWTQSVTSGTTSNVWTKVACSSSGQYALACAHNGYIWYSTNYGVTWTQSGSSILAWFSLAISGSGQYGCAVVYNGAIWYTSNYGQTWTQSTTSGTTAVTWYGVTMSVSGQYVYACITSGFIWYSTNFGQTWTQTASNLGWSAISTSASGQYVCASIMQGSIWYSTNYGITWTSSNASSNTWYSLAMSASGQYQLATTFSPVFTSTAPITSALLFNYRFNINDFQNGNTLNYATGLYDAGLMNSASITNASFKTGSGSLVLNGSHNQHVQLPAFTMTGSITGLTFCCWINFNTSPALYSRIFDLSQAIKNGAGNITGSGTAFTILISLISNTLSFELAGTTSSGTTYGGRNTTPYTAATGIWTHVAWVMSSSAWTIYINGSQVTPTVTTAVTTYLPPTSYNNGIYPFFFIGRSSWSADPYSTGRFNDFRMYTSALNSINIGIIYNSNNGQIGSMVQSSNFGATWTAVTGTHANTSGLALSSTGEYITASTGNAGILTSQTSTASIAVSQNTVVAGNTSVSGQVQYADNSAQVAGPTMDYSSFGQSWTINNTSANTITPLVAVSATGQYQTATNVPVPIGVTDNTPIVTPLPLSVMSGLQMWYDAADPNGTGVTPSAGAITTWIDKSGNGRHAPVTGTFTVILNTMNGLPVVSMTNPLAQLATSYASVSVNGPTVFPAYFNVLSVYRVITNMTYSTPWTYTRSDMLGYPIDQYLSTRYINSGGSGSTYTISAANGTVLVSQLFNPNYVEYLNGSTTAAYTAGGPNTEATSFVIGSRPDTVTSFSGYICEILVYNTQMSSANQYILEGYLAWKWGIQANLPTTHPYFYTNVNTIPRNIPTNSLQLWLDASTLGLANGAPVTTWSTSGGTPYTFTSSTATYRTNTQNGLGVVSFPAASTGGSIANFTLAQTQTIFMVTYAVNQTASAIFLEHGTDPSPGFLLWTGGIENYVINSGTRVAVNGGNITTENTWRIIQGINPDPANSNQLSFYVNGALSATTTTSQLGSRTVTDTLNINVRVTNASYLAELIIYNAALLPAQRQQVEGYLAWKWGIRTSLPASHPYYFAAPANLMVSANYGQSWSIPSISSSPSFNWSATAMSASGQYQVASVTSGTIYYSTTAGTTWVPSGFTPLIVVPLTWTSIAVSASGQYMSACASGASIWYSNTYGQSWISSGVTSLTWTSIAISASGQYQYACHSSSGGAIYVSTTYGRSWMLMPNTAFGTNVAIACSASGQYVYVASSTTGIYWSMNYGQAWSNTFVGSNGSSAIAWSAIKCSASGQYLIATDGASSGLVYFSTNYGENWSSIPGTTFQGPNQRTSLSMSQHGQYILIGAAGNIYQSITGGSVVAPSFVAANPSFSVLPGGIIMQAGSFNLPTPSGTNNTSTAITFPRAFSNAVVSVVVSLMDVGAGSATVTTGAMPQTITLSGFSYATRYNAGSTQLSGYGIQCYWTAVGY